jgi:hypothetical protein
MAAKRKRPSAVKLRAARIERAQTERAVQITYQRLQQIEAQMDAERERRSRENNRTDPSIRG